jgi:UDP-glucuronate decarboxylase
MKILITGGAGFIGSHLCKYYLDQGHTVIALDNFYTGRLENIQSFFQNSNFTFKQHDIIQPIDLDVDWILNFACPASPPHYQKNPIYTTKTNVIGAINMLELARNNKARILQASTSEVYGDPDVHPQQENYRGCVNPIGIRSCYDEGKRCAESLFFDYYRKYNTDIKVIRIFNTYGPNMDPNDGRVVSNFIMQALNNQPITMYGDGSQTRSFCYIDDLIDGITRMMKTDNAVQGTINLGNPDEYTLIELAELIIKLTHSSSKIIFEVLPQDDPRKRCPDIGKAERLLDWKPSTNLTVGLQKTINYFERYFCNPKKKKEVVCWNFLL